MEPGFVFVVYSTHLNTEKKSILVMGLNLQSGKQDDKPKTQKKNDLNKLGKNFLSPRGPMFQGF